ncbi:2-oxoacid:acceptor oxidoreductase family protein [Chlamydiota bacterium]
MYEEIVAAGFGGQGILRLGKILAYAAMKEGRQVTYIPSYGAEVRGGTANCSVVLSDSLIPTPMISAPTAIVIMNNLSYQRFVPGLKNDCLKLINVSLVDTVSSSSETTLLLPFTELAVKLGNIRVANMIALAALVKKKELVALSVLKKSINEIFYRVEEELIDLNLRAIDEGVRLVA